MHYLSVDFIISLCYNMNMRLRVSPPNQNYKEELQRSKSVAGDRVKVLGHQGFYIVEAAGLKLLRLHSENDPSKKMSAFRRDTVKVYE